VDRALSFVPHRRAGRLGRHSCCCWKHSVFISAVSFVRFYALVGCTWSAPVLLAEWCDARSTRSVYEGTMPQVMNHLARVYDGTTHPRHQGIAAAQQQKTRSFELRAALSLAKLTNQPAARPMRTPCSRRRSRVSLDGQHGRSEGLEMSENRITVSRTQEQTLFCYDRRDCQRSLRSSSSQNVTRAVSRNYEAPATANS
jgi:hypothetical protein